MTAFNTSILVTVDKTAASRDVKAFEGDLRSLGASGKSAGATAAAGLKVVDAELAQLKRSQVGVTSNLVAQFNDVGQMLIAGQSPLLLAAQQGTQISQVLGPLGAAGAVRALGAAFLGMLNPVNLAVFGAVAGLGLVAQGISGLIGETKSVEDAFGDLESATKAWREAASIGVGDLTREFGSITPEIIEMQKRLTELKLVEVLLDANQAAKALADQFRDGRFLPGSGKEAKVADLLNTDALAPGSISKLSPDVAEFLGLLEDLKTSDSLEVQISALVRMQELVRSSITDWRSVTEEQDSFLQGSVALERQLRAAQAAEEGIGSAQQISQDRAARMLATLQDEANVRQQITLYGEDSRQASEARVEAERRAFEATLATLDVSDQMKASLREAWDSANGLQGSASDVLNAFLDAAGAGDEIKRAISDAWDVLTGATDATNIWASAMAGVAAEVRGIGAALSTLGGAGIANASKSVELEALRAGKSVSDARRAAQEGEIRRDFEINEKKVGYALAYATMQEQLRGVQLDGELEAARKAASERDRLANKSSRSGAKQTEAGARLIASLERELEILRATDPVQKEMIRNREAMAALTELERQKVEELIAAKLREQKAQEQADEAWEFTKNIAFDALDALIIQGEKASDVMANLASAIAKAFLQSALLGTGPLAGLFGGQGTGLFDGIGSLLGGGDLFSNIGGFATGGMITGPGGPTDDSILARLSNGEFVVNAAATSRHRPLLEAINSAPRFASGGYVGGGTVQGAAGSAEGGLTVIELRLSDDLDARIDERAQGVSVRVARGAIEQYDAKVMPRRMRAVQADPRRVG